MRRAGAIADRSTTLDKVSHGFRLSFATPGTSSHDLAPNSSGVASCQPRHPVGSFRVFIRRRRARFAAINAAYAKYFKTPYPASPTVAVSAPPVGVNVEIDEALDR